MDVILNEHFARNVLDCEKDEMDNRTYEKFNTWIHALLLDLVNILLYKLEHIARDPNCLNIELNINCRRSK